MGDLERWSLRRESHSVFAPCYVLGWNHSGVPLEWEGLALPFSWRTFAQLLSFHCPCSNVLHLEFLEELTCANPPGSRSIPVWHCVVTLPCSTTLDNPG